MEAWPLISKSGQNMCKGGAEELARLAGGGEDRMTLFQLREYSCTGAVHPDTQQSPESSFQTLPTEPLYQSVLEKCHSYVKSSSQAFL